jgi:hypothetical protein
MVLPARSTLERLVASQTARAQEEIFQRLSARLSAECRADLDSLLEIGEGLQEATAAFGSDSPKLALLLNNVAEIDLRGDRKRAEALPVLRRALEICLAEHFEAHIMEGDARLLDVVDVHRDGGAVPRVHEQRISVMDIDFRLRAMHRSESDWGRRGAHNQQLISANAFVDYQDLRPCSEWLTIRRKIEQSAESEMVRPTIYPRTLEGSMDVNNWPPGFQEDGILSDGRPAPAVKVSSSTRCRHHPRQNS